MIKTSHSQRKMATEQIIIHAVIGTCTFLSFRSCQNGMSKTISVVPHESESNRVLLKMIKLWLNFDYSRVYGCLHNQNCSMPKSIFIIPSKWNSWTHFNFIHFLISASKIIMTTSIENMRHWNVIQKFTIFRWHDCRLWTATVSTPIIVLRHACWIQFWW